MGFYRFIEPNCCVFVPKGNCKYAIVINSNWKETYRIFKERYNLQVLSAKDCYNIMYKIYWKLHPEEYRYNKMIKRLLSRSEEECIARRKKAAKLIKQRKIHNFFKRIVDIFD